MTSPFWAVIVAVGLLVYGVWLVCKPVCLAFVATLVLTSLQYGMSSDIPNIRGIPEMPSALPFIGHLHLHAGASGVNDGALWSSWSKRLGSDLLQVKFGRNRVVIANSFNAVRELFVTHGHLTSRRPRQYIFEKYIGTSCRVGCVFAMVLSWECRI